MKNLELHFEHELQGRFELNELNLLLTFQVNCPGCFFYALPLFQSLYQQYHEKKVSFLALSTAFEDFELNTKENTESLIKSGTLIGETKKALSQQGIEKLPFAMDFPIAMDKTITEEKDLNAMANNICLLNPNFQSWSVVEQQDLLNRVLEYLKQLKHVAITFTSNQSRGTPTVVLFNKQKEVLHHWFGHVEHSAVQLAIQHYSEIIRANQNLSE